MVRITEELLRARAEHNDRRLGPSLRELSLAAQSVERIELLGCACRHLRVLLLQGNVIRRIEGLHRLKELHTLNLALNCVARVRGLARCESLARLDLTANFVAPRALPSVASLARCGALRELSLAGNPCAAWPGYRQYVLAALPQLAALDGELVAPGEREAAAAAAPALRARLEAEFGASAARAAAAAAAARDSDADGGSSADDGGEVAETGRAGADGALLRPWCAATRLLDAREAAAEAAEAARRRARGAAAPGGAAAPARRPRLEALPPLDEGRPFLQRNEGGWDYTLEAGADGASLELAVPLGRFLATPDVAVDVQPRAVRLLARGRLLAVRLPAEVRPGAAAAARSRATGRLVLTMPLEDPAAAARDWDLSCERPSAASGGGGLLAAAARQGVGSAGPAPAGGLPAAAVVEARRGGAAAASSCLLEVESDGGGGGGGGADDDDAPPPLA